MRLSVRNSRSCSRVSEGCGGQREHGHDSIPKICPTPQKPICIDFKHGKETLGRSAGIASLSLSLMILISSVPGKRGVGDAGGSSRYEGTDLDSLWSGMQFIQELYRKRLFVATVGLPSVLEKWGEEEGSFSVTGDVKYALESMTIFL